MINNDVGWRVGRFNVETSSTWENCKYEVMDHTKWYNIQSTAVTASTYTNYNTFDAIPTAPMTRVHSDADLDRLYYERKRWEQLAAEERRRQLRMAKPTKQIPPRALIPPDTAGRRAPAGFNRFVNASDMMEEFIAYCGEQGVRQAEMMDLPVELFVKWLVIKACEHEDEDPGITLELPSGPPAIPQPRCIQCKRFMRRDSELALHGRCADRYFTRRGDAGVSMGSAPADVGGHFGGRQALDGGAPRPEVRRETRAPHLRPGSSPAYDQRRVRVGSGG